VPKSVGFLQMFFHFGSIEIETAGTSGQFLFSDAPQPHKIAEKISQNRKKFLEKNSAEKNFSSKFSE
jgi:Bacterial membrane flanked domain.